MNKAGSLLSASLVTLGLASFNSEASGECQNQLFLGLPDTLALSTPTDLKAVVFKPDEGELVVTDAKYKIRRVADGKEISDEEMFHDELSAVLPQDKTLGSYKGAEGKGRWHYPPGTMIFHRIDYRTEVPRLFELRVEKVNEAGRMLFGIYRQRVDLKPGVLSLDRECPPKKQEKVMVPLVSGKAELSYTKIDPSSCLSCHGSPDKELQGEPFEFLPELKSLAEWRGRYKKSHGYDPVVSAP